jgi:ribonuclease-3 family protein
MDLMERLNGYNGLKETEVMMLNPLVWAYIGDAVYEVYVRSYVISQGKRNAGDLHKGSISFVKAEAQSDILEKLLPHLTEEEQNIVRRGRNTKTTHVPKNAVVIDYRRATALEALIGYLYLMRQYERMDEIMGFIFDKNNSENQTETTLYTK